MASRSFVPDHELLLGQISVENGPYMRATFDSLIDADLTDKNRATAVLGGEFTRYLAVYFTGSRLLQRVEPRSRYPGGPVWKEFGYVLVSVRTLVRGLSAPRSSRLLSSLRLDLSP
jgi:hypothetical protein